MTDFASLGVTAESIAYVYSWGVAAVFTPWLSGLAVSVVLSYIRKI